MFRVKICGITNIDDALAAADAGADAIGLNFYAGSPRYCPIDDAGQIARAAPGHVCKVGVFVDATVDEIRAATRQIGLDLVQLHGDQPPEMLQELRPLPVMKVFRLTNNLEPIGEYLEQCHRLVCVPRMVLVDAHRSGQYGGTGETLDWQALAADRPVFSGLPLVLAGGLNPTNVNEAIAVVRPWAVDTASGVEQRPGKKSNELVQRFVAEAHRAFSQDNRRAAT
jgi:phosphoribosylanthranilate isomerase